MNSLEPALARIASDEADPAADFSLPGWIYGDEEFHALEMERIFRPSWQIVCHVNEIPAPGDYRTLDYLGESVIVIRGDDGQVRAFANVCRHRAMRLVEGPSGCAKKLVCPYHAWTFETDGRLSGVPMKADYPALKLEDNGLAAVDLEIWQGFVFVRLEDAGFPSVADMMAPFAEEIAPYRFADMQRMGEVRRIEPHGWADRLHGEVVDDERQNFWEKFYRTHIPRVEHLPEAAHRRWLYYKLWPNLAFDIYADQIDFMQWLPLTPTTCLLREVAYAIPDDRREMKLVRYANWRINRVVNAEDTWLIGRVQQGMASKTYGAGPLAASETCLRSFARKIRTIIPEARQPVAPAPGWSLRHRKHETSR